MTARIDSLIEVRARLLSLMPPRVPSGPRNNKRWFDYNVQIEWVDVFIAEELGGRAPIAGVISKSVTRAIELRRELKSPE